MKKLSTILAITLLYISAFASQVPENKLAAYKEAANLALQNVQLSCTFTPADFKWSDGSTDAAMLSRLIKQANGAILNDSGAQPVLTFKYYGSYMEQSIAITTTADFVSIVSVDASQYNVSSQQVNLGTVVNPNIVTQLIKSFYSSTSCK